MQTYPGLPPAVELIPDVKIRLVNKARKWPIDRQYVCCNRVCKKLCNNNPKRGRGWPIFKKKVFNPKFMPVLMEEQTYNFREIFFASDECGQDLPTECSGADSSSAASSGEQGLA